jgi:hypothetical protein
VVELVRNRELAVGAEFAPRGIAAVTFSLSPSSGFSLRRRLGSAKSMCITRTSDVRVKVRSTRSHMTLEHRRAPPIGPGSEEAVRARSPRRLPDVASASVCDRRRPVGGRRVVVWLIPKRWRQGRVCQLAPRAPRRAISSTTASLPLAAKSSSGVFDPAVLGGVEGGLGAVPEPQLPQDVGDVILDRALGDVELLGYLSVGGPGGD